MSPALYVSVSLAMCVGLCRFGEAWAALRAEYLLTYLITDSTGAKERPLPHRELHEAGGAAWRQQNFRVAARVLDILRVLGR